MAEYLKNVKLRLGILTVEVALIFSFVIAVGYFFLPGNGMMKHLDGIIDVVLGRVTADTGDYKPSGLWEPPVEPPTEDVPEIKDTTAKGVVTEAVKEAFTGNQCKNKDILNKIIEVKIVSDGNGKRRITILTNASGDYQNIESYFSGNGSNIISGIIDKLPGGDTVTDGIYKFEL